MQKTDNYELNLPEAEDFFNVEDFNDNTKKIDEVLESLENPEHDTRKQAEVEELASGESLKVALRKLAKAVSDYISHKADQVVHITAEERNAWNAKLGVEKIAANLATDTDGMVLAAAMGKNLKEQIDTNANAISTLNSNISERHWAAVSYDENQFVHKYTVQTNETHLIVATRDGTTPAFYIVYTIGEKVNTHKLFDDCGLVSLTSNGKELTITLNLLYTVCKMIQL